MTEDRWTRAERIAVHYLHAGLARRWRRRMSYAARVEALKATLREGKSLGFVLRWNGRPLRPRRMVSIMQGHRLRLPRGGYYLSLAVRSNEAAFHHFRVLVVFPEHP